MKFSVYQTSDQGGREKNEDRMGYCYTREAGLFVLADGMGGHPDGEVAAQIAIQTVSALFQQQAKPKLKDVGRFLGDALLAAHHKILQYAGHPVDALDTPRTTLVAAVVQDGSASWIHCGDSRMYLVRGSELLVRTRDHSYLELRTPAFDDAMGLNRNVLYTCLGSPSLPVYDLDGPIVLEHGDRLLLCSDGLWSMFDDETIAHHLGRRPVASAIPFLVGEALERAGSSSDNVTAVAMQWEMPGVQAAAAGITTDEMHDELFASTIQAEPFDGLDDGHDELDDAEIERTIAEINAAIQRTAARKP